MNKKRKKEIEISRDANKLKAFVSVFFSVIGVIVSIILWRNEEYVRFYTKESLILFIGFVIASLLQGIIVVGKIVMILMVILWVITWIYALQGIKKETFIVGDLAKKINL